MHNMKLSVKIILTMLISIVGMIIIGLSSYIGVSKIGEEIHEITEYHIPISKYTIEIEKDILKEEILTYELFIYSKDIKSAKFKEIVKKIHNLEKKTDEAIYKVEELVANAIENSTMDIVKDRYKSFLAELKILEKEQKSFEKNISIFLDDLQKGDMEHALKEKKILIKELKIMDKHIEKLLTQITDFLEQSALQTEKDEKRILLIIEIIAVIVTLLSIIVSVLLIKFFNRSINEFKTGIKGFFSYLNGETQTVTPLDDKREDEIGEVSKSVNRYIKKAQSKIEEDKNFISSVNKIVVDIKEGKLNSKVDVQTENESYEVLKNSLNDMLSTLEQNIGKDINKILEVLHELSQLNFDKKILNASGKVENALNEVITLINKMLQDNKRNGLGLETSANDLLSNMHKLNTSSNEAAASLEETSAALEEITANVTSTTHKIKEMSSLANEVTNSSSDGQKLASKTTLAMEEINEKVSAINEAITVIDQIAFQTNILSLNAAVEAATAGEAGKGFAVVAQEVRNLASRSAEAAKEIKELVENANIKTNEGKNISNEMIKGYDSLSSDISKTIDLINDVSNAAREQEDGIVQINDAINLLDRQTQQNASVATQTQDIATHTASIAKNILDDVDNKNFENKDSIQAVNNYEQVTKKSFEKPKSSQPKLEEKIIEVVKETTSDDEWENF